ncbi:hypothetical protein [Streptomyces sp. NPDC054834]
MVVNNGQGSSLTSCVLLARLSLVDVSLFGWDILHAWEVVLRFMRLPATACGSDVVKGAGYGLVIVWRASAHR